MIISANSHIISVNLLIGNNNNLKTSDKSIKPMEKPSYFLMPRDFVFPHENFPLGVKKITDQTEHSYHVHEDFSELVVIGRGHAVHLIDDVEYPIGPGDVFVILGDRIHAYTGIRGDFEINNILFDWKKLDMPLYDLERCTGFQVLFNIDPQSREKNRFENRFRLNAAQLSAVREIIDEMELVLNSSEQGYQFRAITSFYRLINNLVVNYSQVETVLGLHSIPHLLGELVSCMERDYARPITIEEMCRRTNMSRANLFRQFKRYFQETPLTYLQGIRMEQATRLLLNSELSMGEIAGMTGFSDGTYFARQFRASTGFRPGEFRKEFQPEK